MTTPPPGPAATPPATMPSAATPPAATPSGAALRDTLRSCLAVDRFIREVEAAGPFGSPADVVDAVRAAAATLRADEIDEALADHPRIGERHAGSGTSSALSRREQAASASDDPVLAARLVDGNKAYEERFGRIFLIRAAGRSRAEIVAELERRLGLDDAEERAVVAGELAAIAVLRAETLFGAEPVIPTTPATPGDPS